MFCIDGCVLLERNADSRKSNIIVSIVNALTPPLLIYLISDGYPIQKLEIPNLKYPIKLKRGG